MKSSRAIPWAIGIAIIIITISASIYWMLFQAPVRATGQWVDVFKEALNFNGRITVNQTVFIEGNTDITELAIREKAFTYRYEWKHQWGGSTKIIELEGAFRGKAGYDLTGQLADPQNPWGIDISEEGRVITARMPAPAILSVEMINYKILEDKSGIWNRVKSEDRENAVNGLQRGARRELRQSGILQEVDGAFIKQIEDAAKKSAPSDFKVIREPIP